MCYVKTPAIRRGFFVAPVLAFQPCALHMPVHVTLLYNAERASLHAPYDTLPSKLLPQDHDIVARRMGH